MTQKKLQGKSKYAAYDINNDGIVSDEEFEHMAEIKRLEHDLRKQRAQRRMATASLVAMAAFTAAMFFVDLERVKAHENPKDTVSIKFATPADARATVRKVKRINKPYARKIQILTVMEQRAKVMKKAEVVRIAKSAKESLKRARKK